MRHDEAGVAVGYADVNDLRHDQGRNELENGLQPLERGREHALQVVSAKVPSELEHVTSYAWGPPSSLNPSSPCEKYQFLPAAILSRYG